MTFIRRTHYVHRMNGERGGNTCRQRNSGGRGTGIARNGSRQPRPARHQIVLGLLESVERNGAQSPRHIAAELDRACGRSQRRGCGLGRSSSLSHAAVCSRAWSKASLSRADDRGTTKGGAVGRARLLLDRTRSQRSRISRSEASRLPDPLRWSRLRAGLRKLK